MEKRELTCIGCPMGCQITVEYEGENIHSVVGNSCAIGDHYARQEVIHPERTVTSTVLVTGGDKPRCSVKTQKNIPKDKIFDCMDAINRTKIAAPVKIGDVVIHDVCGTGVDVVATRNIVKVQHKSFEERLAEYGGNISVYHFDWGEPKGREMV